MKILNLEKFLMPNPDLKKVWYIDENNKVRMLDLKNKHFDLKKYKEYYLSKEDAYEYMKYCYCSERDGIKAYYYLLKGFEIDETLRFTPKYCPWCGKEIKR